MALDGDEDVATPLCMGCLPGFAIRDHSGICTMPALHGRALAIRKATTRFRRRRVKPPETPTNRQKPGFGTGVAIMIGVSRSIGPGTGSGVKGGPV